MQCLVASHLESMCTVYDMGRGYNMTQTQEYDDLLKLKDVTWPDGHNTTHKISKKKKHKS